MNDEGYELILKLLNADPGRAYSDQEVADCMGISRAAVQLIEKRALRKLKIIMTREGWFSSKGIRGGEFLGNGRDRTGRPRKPRNLLDR